MEEHQKIGHKIPKHLMMSDEDILDEVEEIQGLPERKRMEALLASLNCTYKALEGSREKCGK